MADRPSMKDGLSELFRRTDSGGAPSESGAQDVVVKGRPYVTTIKVVGIGGAGTNAVNRMVDSGVKGVEFIAVNTDVQQLGVCDADVKIHIGQEITHGLGGGANPDVGREAMEPVRTRQLSSSIDSGVPLSLTRMCPPYRSSTWMSSGSFWRSDPNASSMATPTRRAMAPAPTRPR